MNNHFSRAVVPIGMLLFVIYIISDVFGSNTNNLRGIFTYVGGLLILLALIKPKIALYVMIFVTAYVDLVKRLLVIDANVNFLDVYYILAFPPITVLAICVGVVLNKTRRGSLTIRDIKLIIAGVIAFGVMAGLSIITGGGINLGNIAAVAQSSAYIVFIFLVPMIFDSPEDILKFIKTCVLVFIPVGLYAIYQYYQGLSNFELAYLETGYSGESRHLGRGVAGNEYFRLNFSTLNSSAAVSAMMSLFTSLLLLRFYVHNRDGFLRKKFLAFPLLICPLFMFAAYTTFTRSGWLSGILAIVALVIFRYRSLLVISYGIGILSILSLFVFPEAWMDALKEGVFQLDDEVSQKAVNTSTWQARLFGFQNLHDRPELWQPFGLLGNSGVDHDWNLLSHDLLTYLIIRYGYIPFVLLCIVIGYFLYKMHSQYFKLQKGNVSQLFILSLSFVVGAAASGLTNMAALSVFPMNFYMWFFVGVIVYLSRREFTSEYAQIKANENSSNI